MSKPLILCADDFGQDPHISCAILHLAKEKRLSATSCMTTEKDWSRHGPDLKALWGQIDIGLHFNLTHGQRRGERSLNPWILSSLLRQVDKVFIEQTLNDQIDSFLEVMGHPPDFIDGHQHVHILPIIRNILIKVINKRFPLKKPYVRALMPMLSPGDDKGKASIIKVLAFRFSRALDRHYLNHNVQFGGVYSLHPQAPYRDFMKSWLQNAMPGALLMCHPGVSPRHPSTDPIQATRLGEYAYLSNEAFLEDCARAKVRLTRFKL